MKERTMQNEASFSSSAWIGSGEKHDAGAVDYITPALRLRQTFQIDGEITRAECRISGLGCYVLQINGKRVGDDVLSPAFTDYNRRVLYVEYDVGAYLRIGENTVAVELGNGFYNQTTEDIWGYYKASWRDEVKLLFELTVNGKTACEAMKPGNALTTERRYTMPSERASTAMQENGTDGK